MDAQRHARAAGQVHSTQHESTTVKLWSPKVELRHMLATTRAIGQVRALDLQHIPLPVAARRQLFSHTVHDLHQGLVLEAASAKGPQHLCGGRQNKLHRVSLRPPQTLTPHCKK